MSLALVLCALGALAATALLALLFAHSNRASLAIGSAGAILASAAGLVGSILFLADPPAGRTADLRLGWSVPVGSLHFGLDALSAFFLTCLFLVAALATVFGLGLMPSFAKRRLAIPTALFNVMVAATAGVLLARDGVLFLVAWELMSVCLFFLVTFEHDREETRRAGFTYLIGSHAGLVLLMAVFGLLAHNAGGSFDFDAFAAAGAPASAGVVFLLAVFGFGTKAGFWPVHVCLPDAYPVAPGNVTSMMSGILIKLGVYGVLRTLDFLGMPAPWWGMLLVAIGLLSDIIGVVHALAQHDLTRLLAYSSVENIGIVALGLGLGLLAHAHGHAELAFLGFAGALLHVLNHGLFKGLLFQAAGCVQQGTHSRTLDFLGGLSKRMPGTGLLFLAGTLAICALPPFNGFVSEWLIYLAAFRSSAGLPAAAAVFAVAVVAGLALIGGLAAACFVRAFGMVFLGHARTPAADHAVEAPRLMRLAPALAAVLCLMLGVLPQAGLFLVSGPASVLAHLPAHTATNDFGPLVPVTRIALVLLALVLGLALLRRFLLGRAAGEVRAGATWGCGYAAPTARMQYTGASFSQPVLSVFAQALHMHARAEPPTGYFPEHARVEEVVGDLAGERLLLPAVRRLTRGLGRMRVLQHGKLHLYLVYVLITLIALLAWQLAAS